MFFVALASLFNLVSLDDLKRARNFRDLVVFCCCFGYGYSITGRFLRLNYLFVKLYLSIVIYFDCNININRVLCSGHLLVKLFAV